MSDTTREHALLQALCTQLASGLAALLGGSSSVTAGAEPLSEGWHARLGLSGRGSGQMWIGLATADANAITKRILGNETDPAEGTIRDTLRELIGQAATAVTLDAVGTGLEIAVEAVEPSFAGIPTSRPSSWSSQVGDSTIVFTVWSALTIDEVARTPAKPAPPRPLSTGSDTLDVILDIDLPMSVRFGRTELALGALTRLGPGSIIDLGRSPDEPVEVLVSGRVVALGDVVVVGGNYGVRITDVVSRPDGGLRS